MPLTGPPSRSLDPFSAGIALGTDSFLDAYLIQPRTAKTNPLAGRNVTTWNMDEAYEGKALGLQDTIIDWLWTANQTFYTEWCLPWKPVDDIYVEWQIFEANAHILGQNPHQATARLISQRRHTRRAALVRRGIGFQIERDWAKTALGRQSILIGMGQIARSYQETANAEVIRALLHAAHWQQQYVRENGQVRRMDHLDYLRYQRDYFAYFQKTKNGPELWDSATDAEANRYHGRFDTIIMPERMYNYITMVPPEKTEYYRRGPKGPAAIDGKGGWTMPAPRMSDDKEPHRWLAQKRVYQARAYHVEGVEPLELLGKNVQQGEYNYMNDEHCKYDDGNYRSEERDILVFDEDRDRFSRITLRHALEHCQLFDDNGDLRDLQAPENGGVTADMASDFLSRVEAGGARVLPVRVLGDIGFAHMDVDMLDKMAETLLAREYRGRAEQRRLDENSANDFGNVAKPSQATLNILGSDNAFMSSAAPGGAKPYDKLFTKNAADPTKANVNSQMPIPKAFSETLVEFGQQIVGEALTQRRLQSEVSKASTLGDLRTNFAPWLEKNCVGSRAEGYKFEKPEQIRVWFSKTLDDMAARLGEEVQEPVERRLPESAAELGLFREHLQQERDYADEDYGEPQYTGSRFQSVGTLYELGKHGRGLDEMKERRETAKGVFSTNIADASDGMFDYHLKQINDSSMSVLKKSRAILLLGCRIRRQFFESCISNNLLFPMNFLILRPHGTWRGRTCIKMLGGGEAGNTYFAHGSAEVGHDANRMISVLHSVAYMAAIVQNAQYVYAAPNLLIDAYYGGLGMGFFNPTSYQKRSPDGSENSIIVVAVPYKERQFPNPLDIAGRFYTDYDNGLVDIRHNDDLHYSTAYRYNNKEYLFYTRSNPQDELSEPTVIPEHVHMNRICWQGAQYMYNRVSGKFDYCELNTSGWGDLVYPGCGRVRRGGDLYLDPSRMKEIAVAN